MKPGKSYELVRELTKTLDATHSPAIKDGIAYSVMVFHTPEPDLWVACMIPLNLNCKPADVLDTVNQAYSSFRDGQPSTTGILFFEHLEPSHMISQVDHWYNDSTRPNQNTGTSQATYCN
jgi:hypothetical protein